MAALRDAFARHGVEYLFIGKSAALIQGFPDTTQDTDVFPANTPENARALVAALREVGFAIDAQTESDLVRGKDFVHLRSGPFDVDIVFAPDGIESFEAAWRRGRRKEGFPVCAMRDVIASKRAANRAKDRETLPRLEGFRQWLDLHPELKGERLPPRDAQGPSAGAGALLREMARYAGGRSETPGEQDGGPGTDAPYEPHVTRYDS